MKNGTIVPCTRRMPRSHRARWMLPKLLQEFSPMPKSQAILCPWGLPNAKAEPEVRYFGGALGSPLATTLLAAGFCAQYPLYLGISGSRVQTWLVETLAAE